MELESIHLLWNLVLTGIVAPFVWFIVQLHNETKRLELVHKIFKSLIAKDNKKYLSQIPNA